MQLHTLRRILPAVLLGTLGAGCAGGLGSNFKNPDFNLQQVVVRGAGLQGGALDLVVRVDNPNNIQLRGTKLELGFDVETSHVGDISYDNEFDLPGNGSTTVTLPIRFTWSGVGGAFRSVLGYGDIPYKMKGQATLQLGGGKVVVPFTREGRAPLTRSSSAPVIGASGR